MKKIMANNGRSQIAAKGGVVSTQALIYQALHDVFNFSKKRLDALTARVNQYYQDGYTNGFRLVFWHMGKETNE